MLWEGGGGPLGKLDPSGGTDISGSQQTYTMNLQDYHTGA